MMNAKFALTENAERLYREVLSLPMKPLMSAEEMVYIVKNLVAGN